MAEYPSSKVQQRLGAVTTARATEAERLDTFTALPGKIVSFDAAKQTATVAIQYKPRLAGEAVDFPDLLEVPVMVPRGGGFSLTLPIAVGDGGMVQIQSRSTEAWYLDGEAAEVPQARAHDLSDAVFVPGLEPLPRAIEGYDPANATITGPNGKVTMTPAGATTIETPASTMTLKEDGSFDVQNEFGRLAMNQLGQFALIGTDEDGNEQNVMQVVQDALQVLIGAVAPGSGAAFNPATVAALQAVAARLSSISIPL